jgi:hypothetical protein
MILKPQDILFLLKLVTIGKEHWIYNSLALDLGMSPSQVHAAAKRSLGARLAVEQDGIIRPHIRNLKQFLSNGLQYVFVPEKGELSRGMPTSYAGVPMSNEFVKDNDPPPVWPDSEGTVRGVSFSPLYKSAPDAAKKDSKLYELLVLVDALRGGRARERNYARKELKKRLDQYESKS